MRGFLATVIDVKPDGSYVFSLRDTVNHYIENTYNFDDEYLAVITGIADHDYSAISLKGIGLYVEHPTDNTECRIGDIVKVRFMNIGQQGQLKAYILPITPTTRTWYSARTRHSAALSGA